MAGTSHLARPPRAPAVSTDSPSPGSPCRKGPGPSGAGLGGDVSGRAGRVAPVAGLEGGRGRNTVTSLRKRGEMMWDELPACESRWYREGAAAAKEEARVGGSAHIVTDATNSRSEKGVRVSSLPCASGSSYHSPGGGGGAGGEPSYLGASGVDAPTLHSQAPGLTRWEAETARSRTKPSRRVTLGAGSEVLMGEAACSVLGTALLGPKFLVGRMRRSRFTDHKASVGSEGNPGGPRPLGGRSEVTKLCLQLLP